MLGTHTSMYTFTYRCKTKKKQAFLVQKIYSGCAQVYIHIYSEERFAIKLLRIFLLPRKYNVGLRTYIHIIIRVGCINVLLFFNIHKLKTVALGKFPNKNYPYNIITTYSKLPFVILTFFFFFNKKACYVSIKKSIYF